MSTPRPPVPTVPPVVVPNPFEGIDAPSPTRTPNVVEMRVPVVFHVAAWMFVLSWPFVLGGCLSIKAQIVNTTFWFFK